MTLKEFQEIEDCDVCPFLIEGECPGGWSSGYGGVPIEPPCCGWSDDDLDIDMEDLLHDHYTKQLSYERYMDEIAEAERIKREKNDKRAATRKAMESYCVKERVSIKELKKRINALKKQEQFAISLANAFNFANEAFRYEERYNPNPVFTNEITRLEGELALAEEAYKLKRKEFYTKRKSEQQNANRE